MLSGVMSCAVAVITAEHGVVAEPPYATSAVTSTIPVGIVTGDVTAAHVGLSEVNVTSMPGEGAAIVLPPLSNLTVIVVPKLSLMLTELSSILRFAVEDTVDWAEPCVALVAETVTVPGAIPATVALAVMPPSGIVTVGVGIDTTNGSLLMRLITSPPTGAGVEIVSGSDAVPPNGTLAVVGRLRT
jgi:hypothetical protein